MENEQQPVAAEQDYFASLWRWYTELPEEKEAPAFVLDLRSKLTDLIQTIENADDKVMDSFYSKQPEEVLTSCLKASSMLSEVQKHLIKAKIATYGS